MQAATWPADCTRKLTEGSETVRRLKHAAPVPPDAALTIEQARAVLNIGRHAILRLLASGELRSFRVTERNVRIRRSALDEFMARREAEMCGTGNAA